MSFSGCMEFAHLKAHDSLFQANSQAGSFLLKASSDKLEFFHVYAQAGRTLLMHPNESKGGLCIFYILRGKAVCSEKKITAGESDTIAVKNLSKTVIFKIIEDTEFLVVTEIKFFQKQVAFFMKMSDAMNKIQKKDEYTANHCNRTGELALHLGQIMGLNDEALNDLVFAAKLHDIGKTKIPTAILNKPAIYNPAEYELIKNHPVHGFNMLKNHVPDAVSLIIRQHHEKCDGSGYPDQLCSSQILAGARILAVADVFDALTSNRPYRSALPVWRAFSCIRKMAGYWWDRDAVESLYSYLATNYCEC